MRVPKQLLRTLVALVVTSVLASVPRGGQSCCRQRRWLWRWGITEVADLPADSAFDYMKRLQPGHLMLEQMEANAGCLESPEIDEVGARILRDSFTAACIRP
jgi:hypothetical protein